MIWHNYGTALPQKGQSQCSVAISGGWPAVPACILTQHYCMLRSSVAPTARTTCLPSVGEPGPGAPAFSVQILANHRFTGLPLLHQGALCPGRGPGDRCILALAGRDKQENAPGMCPPRVPKLPSARLIPSHGYVTDRAPHPGLVLPGYSARRVI